MKKIIKNTRWHLFAYLIIAVLFTACKKRSDYNEMASADKTKPGPVTNVSVTNTPGGANLRYQLPKSPNILYVQANYKINDRNAERVQKSSYVLDTMALAGFQKSQDYTVALTVVTKAGVSSDPVTVTVHPDTPPYIVAGQHASLIPAFGGTYISSVNPDTSQYLKYVILLYDSADQKLKPFYQAASKDSVPSYSVRGLASKPTQFGVYFSDLYGNNSDTTLATLTPLPEVLLDGANFTMVHMPSDNNSGGVWPFASLWNNTFGDGPNNCWRGIGEAPGKFPIALTFDMHTTTKLSRFVYWPRLDIWSWQNENPRHFGWWGSSKANPLDAQLPSQSNKGDVVGDWVNLGNFEPYPQPSGGNPSQPTGGDKAFARAGWEYPFAPDSPPVRWLRFVAYDSYTGYEGFIVTELKIYGAP